MRNWLRRLFAPASQPQAARASPPPVGYAELIAPLPIPSAGQTESFAKYMVGAHSWYKHLPCEPPGAPFVVFLDPNAGRALVESGGRTRYRDRVHGQAPFHHTWMPTAEYLAKFGHWHYATDRGTEFVVQRPGDGHNEVWRHSLARVTAPDGASIAVSPELLAAGTVHLSAHVHTLFDANYVYMLAHRARKFREDHGAEYPSHGQDILDLFDRHKDDLPGLDRQVEAERARQHAELLGALHRVRTLLAGGA